MLIDMERYEASARRGRVLQLEGIIKNLAQNL